MLRAGRVVEVGDDHHVSCCERRHAGEQVALRDDHVGLGGEVLKRERISGRGRELGCLDGAVAGDRGKGDGVADWGGSQGCRDGGR